MSGSRLVCHVLTESPSREDKFDSQVAEYAAEEEDIKQGEDALVEGGLVRDEHSVLIEDLCGSSILGISAVGWAKKMVFPEIPFCRTSGAPLPKRTCFMQHLPKDANIFVASEASRRHGLKRPPQLSLVKPLRGSFGFWAQMSATQSQHIQTRAPGSPMPAHCGLSAGFESPRLLLALLEDADAGAAG